MFFQLSKDKTLHNVLLKHDLDSETRELVENQASPSIIKRSLLENMDSTNVVEYRKLIEKTILKEKEDYGEFEGDTNLGGDQKFTTSRRNKEREAEASSNLAAEEMQQRIDRNRASSQMSAEQKEKWEEETTYKKARKEISLLLDTREKLNKLISNVEVKTNISPPAITGSKGYNNLTASDSEFIIKVLVKMSTLPELNKKSSTGFIIDRYKKLANNGEFPMYARQMYKKEKGERTIKNKITSEVNIFDLNITYSNFANAIIDKTPSNKDMSLVEVLGLLHLREHNTEPLALANPKQIASDFRNLANKISGRDPKGLNTNFKRTTKSLKKTISDIKQYLTWTNELHADLKNSLDKFNTVDDDYLLEYAEEILSERAKELAVGLKVFRIKDDGDKDEEDKDGGQLPEYIVELQKEIDELRQNPERQLDEIVMDLANQWLEIKEDYSSLYGSFNMAFMKQLVDEISKIETLLLDADGVENPSKKLTSKLSELKPLLRRLFSNAKSLIKELSDLDEDTKEKWDSFLAVDGTGLQEMKPPKRTRSEKDSPSPSTIGARIDNTMRLLMEISEEQAENELSKLGVDKENITEINMVASKIEDEFSDLSSLRDEINSLLPQSSEKDYSQKEYVPDTKFEYDIPSWIQEDFNPDKQMGGKDYGDD